MISICESWTSNIAQKPSFHFHHVTKAGVSQLSFLLWKSLGPLVQFCEKSKAQLGKNSRRHRQGLLFGACLALVQGRKTPVLNMFAHG